MRTISNGAHLFQPVEDIISTEFIPSIFGHEISHLDGQLYALPIRDGGLGIPCTPDDADFELNSSKVLSASLSALIISQSSTNFLTLIQLLMRDYLFVTIGLKEQEMLRTCFINN